ncbi:hypothetical protein TNCV_763711 [Trichonephila clavipes]|nr:hypothetical protein TNCV_763711 [Trichonephila clavipes]
MNRCTNAELVNIHFICYLVNGNGRVAVQLYEERYPTRRQPNNQTFPRVHQNLAEHRSFRATIDDTTVNSEKDLVASIASLSATNRETLDIFKHVHHLCRIDVVRVMAMTAI